VFKVEREERRLGGAGNVAEMLMTLGADVRLFGLIGIDDGRSLPGRSALNSCRVVSRFTTQKTRFIVNGDLVGPRIDLDSSDKSSADDVRAWKFHLDEWKPDAIIIADHGKGVVTPELMTMVASLGVPVFIDPIKTTPYLHLDYGFGFAACAAGDHEIPGASLRAECFITKRGPDGLVWSVKDDRNNVMRSECKHMVDPLGAGDQLIAALAYQRCLGVDWPDAIRWANVASGIQCERRGCVPVTVAEVEERIAENRHPLA
jgi:bifunctional ADP-heptose synthase (sugar kinase/adenylyltransferase)